MRGESDVKDCLTILKKAQSAIGYSFGQLNELIEDLERKENTNEQRKHVVSLVTNMAKEKQIPVMQHLSGPLGHIGTKIANALDASSFEFFGFKPGIAFDIQICALWLFGELMRIQSHETQVDVNSVVDPSPQSGSGQRETISQRSNTRVIKNQPSPNIRPQARQTHVKKYYELRLLVESTHLIDHKAKLDRMHEQDDRSVNDELLTALMKRVNSYKLHTRTGPTDPTIFDLMTLDGGHVLDGMHQLYVCLEICFERPRLEEMKKLEKSSTALAMLRRLKSSRVRLLTLRHEKVNDTDRVQTGEEP